MADQLTLGIDPQPRPFPGRRGTGEQREVIEVALSLLAGKDKPFTADDVHVLVRWQLGDGYDPNRVSSRIGVWAQRGWIRKTGQVPVRSQRRSRHSSSNWRWVGTGHGRTEVAA